MLKNQLLKLSRYNYWANEKSAGFIISAGRDKADLPQVSSFPTILKTAYHIWDAELVWLKRLHGETIAFWPPSKKFEGSLEEGLKAMLSNSEKIIDYLEGATEESLQQSLNYASTSKVQFCSKICDMIMHCLNHSTYHRGQLVTMLRVAGFINVSSTDYITYCRIS